MGLGSGDDVGVHGVSAASGLFGREDALRVVSALFVGGGSAVAVGDPGAGKSALLKVAAQLAKASGMSFCWARWTTGR